MRAANPPIGSDLYKNKKEFDHEIVYELTTKDNGLPFGVAIADIEQSVPHFHKKTRETYTCVQGDLEVSIGKTKHIIRAGDRIEVPIGEVHSAKTLGKEPGRIIVVTIPEWSAEDHFIVES